MDYVSLLLAVLMFMQEFHSPNANSYSGPQSTKTSRCSSRQYCRANHGQDKHPACEQKHMTPCMKSRELFKSLGGKLVLCDTESDGGGWILIQRRFNFDVNFRRNWADYKNGFGSLDGDFWIGNDFISQLTQAGYNEVRFDLKFEGRSYYTGNGNFSVQNEAALYRMTVGNYTGNATNYFRHLNGRSFTTIDRDNDAYSGDNCARCFHGGWWYNGCHTMNINGQHGNVQYGQGLNFRPVTTFYQSLSFIEMKVRKPSR
ncbi:ficolin-1-like [Physella acuta]|uniref:ficolin-1-like n=1 Tax=Physella acuta TaxID=109671 RepID=UPI0027DDE1C4|nr:ficolin-1-like [Physella acuta]